MMYRKLNLENGSSVDIEQTAPRLVSVRIKLYTSNKPLTNDMFSDNFRITKFNPYSSATILWEKGNFVYVEELLNSILSSLKIGPVCRPLFGLEFMHNKSTFWVAPQIKLKEFFEEWHKLTKETIPTLRLRLRFGPSNLTTVEANDKEAYKYMHLHFANTFYKNLPSWYKPNNKEMPWYCGNGMIEQYRRELEYSKQIQECQKSRLVLMFFIFSYKFRLPTFKPFFLSTYITKRRLWLKKFKESLDLLSDSHLKMIFSNEVYRIFPAIEEYCVNIDQEAVTVKIYDSKSDEGILMKLETMTCTQETQTFSIKNLVLAELILQDRNHYIAQLKFEGLESFNLCFTNLLLAKSFLSCIDGYYRLSKKWAFNICNQLTSHSLEMLKSMNCHGPIGIYESSIKLKRYKLPMSYLIRQQKYSSEEFIIDIYGPEKDIQSKKICYNSLDKTFTVQQDDTLKIASHETLFKTLSDLIEVIHYKPYKNSSVFQLTHCIIPNDGDDYVDLLLCLPTKKVEEFLKKDSDTLPFYIDKSSILEKFFLKPRHENGFFVYKANIVGAGGVTSYFAIKEWSKEDVLYCTHIKNRLKSWVRLQHEGLVKQLGYEEECSGLVMDYLFLGSLSTYISKAGKKFDTYQKMNSAIQLASALVYMQEKHFTHGMIRCHNILIVSLQPLVIRLADPLGKPNMFTDMAFYPPEYMHLKLTPMNYDSGLDIWAYGTTIWQLFNDGFMPAPDTPATCLHLTNMTHCNTLRHIVKLCWTIDPKERIQPRTLYRDINSCSTETKSYYEYVDSLILLSEVNSTRSQDSPALSMTPVSGSNIIRFEKTRLELQAKVGMGFSGSVYRALLDNDGTQSWVAVKTLNNKKTSRAKKLDLVKECEILNTLNHPNIIKTIGLATSPDELYLVLEFVPLGNLLTHMKNCPMPDFDQIPLKQYALDIVSAAEYLEKKGIIHRDLALRNVLLESCYHVKLCDFGLAIHEHEVHLSKHQHIPSMWAAPEVLTERCFSHSSDVWSFGILLWELFTGGYHPSYACDFELLYDFLKQGSRLPQQRCPNYMFKLMNDCWSFYPQDRCNFSEITQRIEGYSDSIYYQ